MGVEFQSQKPATPAKGTVVKTTNTADGQVQHVNVDSSALPTGAASADNQTNGDQKVQIVDLAGSVVSPLVAYKLPTVSTPYLYAIAEGDIANHMEFERLGFNGDIDIAEEDVWGNGGAYVFPAAPQQMELVSTSVADDGDPQGTGIGVVTLYYLDTDGTLLTEDITLNGTNVVTTVATNIWRVNALKAKVVGTGGSAAGTITIRNLANTPVYSSIAPGQTRDRNAIYTVPKDYTLFITSMYAGATSTAANAALVTLRAKYDHEAGAARTFFLPHAELQVASTGGGISRPFELPIRFPELTDIKVSASSLGNNCVVSCGLRGWLEQEIV